MPKAGFTTRFAPAPTGFLHLGHVTSALAVWSVARAFGGRVLLRIEDHDRTRSRPEFERAILEDLEWLGFEPDAPVTRQSEREDLYRSTLASLAASGLVYACACSRKAMEAAAEPTVAANSEIRYAGTCRDVRVDESAEVSRRVRLAREVVSFDDLRLGRITQVPAEQCGDLVVRDRHGNWTYQFAVTVDDFDQGVDLVIRGEDLLSSTGRQIQLGRMIGRSVPGDFLHHPLILRSDGQKLSKSNHDTGIRDLRAAGWSRERVIGAAAAALALSDREPISLVEITDKVRACPSS